MRCLVTFGLLRQNQPDKFSQFLKPGKNIHSAGPSSFLFDLSWSLSATSGQASRYQFVHVADSLESNAMMGSAFPIITTEDVLLVFCRYCKCRIPAADQTLQGNKHPVRYWRDDVPFLTRFAVDSCDRMPRSS